MHTTNTEPAAVADPETRRKRRAFLPEFRENRRNWGTARGLHWAMMTLIARTVGFHVHYVHVGADRPDLRDPDAPQVPPGYTARMIWLDDLTPYIGRIPGLTEEFLAQAFEPGSECSGCFYDGELVAFSFNKRSRAPVTDQLDVLVPTGFRYGYKGWTHPAHTQRQLQKLCTWIKHRDAGRPFTERSISYVETHNYASLLHGYRRPQERLILMGYVGWFRWFGREIPWNSRQAKRIGFEFVRREDPARRQYIR